MTTDQFGDVSRFCGVDFEADPQGFIRFVDTMNALPDIQAIKERMIVQLRLQPGHRVLDLGCGTGDDARRLAELVAPSGHAVGVDFSQAMVEEARARAEGSGLPVEFHQGNATALDLPDGAFDAARCERLLIHVPDAAAAVAEMVRVTRPGGRVVVFDVDFDTIVVDHPDLVMTRRIMTAMCDKLTNGRIGRQLPRLLRDAGLDGVAVEGGCVTSAPFSFMAAMMWGTLGSSPEVIDPADLAAWLAPLEEADKAGRLFGAMTGFIVSGARPREVQAPVPVTPGLVHRPDTDGGQASGVPEPGSELAGDPPTGRPPGSGFFRDPSERGQEAEQDLVGLGRALLLGPVAGSREDGVLPQPGHPLDHVLGAHHA